MLTENAPGTTVVSTFSAKSKRQQAQELRAQGKYADAFFVLFGAWIGIAAFVLVTVGAHLYSSHRLRSIAEEGAEINQQLESLEALLRLSIESGDRARALELVDQLFHPLNEQWKDQSKWDAWYGYPNYSDWWGMKREEYKDRIMALPTRHPSHTYPSVVHLDRSEKPSSSQSVSEMGQ